MNFCIIVVKLYKSKESDLFGESLDFLTLITEVINGIINILLIIKNARINKDIIIFDVFICQVPYADRRLHGAKPLKAQLNFALI